MRTVSGCVDCVFSSPLFPIPIMQCKDFRCSAMLRLTDYGGCRPGREIVGLLPTGVRANKNFDDITTPVQSALMARLGLMPAGLLWL